MDIDRFINEICYLDPEYSKDFSLLEDKYKCTISCSIEKHNSLQYTYFYEVDFGKEELFNIEIESGINNGTQVNNAEWGFSSKPDTKTIEVLSDIKLDMSFYKKGTFNYKKALSVLEANKNRLFKHHRNNSYDNYVTGGNSKLKSLSELDGLHLNYIYVNKEVDCNFI